MSMKNSEKEFYVRLPMRAAIRIMSEVDDARAFGLFWYYLGRTTREWRVDGIKAGAVFGCMAKCDSAVADELSTWGMRCNRQQVRRWREKLAERGLIAQVRSRFGYRILVMDTDKFPDERAEDLPERYRAAVVLAFSRYSVVGQAKRARCLQSEQRDASQNRNRNVRDVNIRCSPCEHFNLKLNNGNRKRNTGSSEALAFESGQLRISQSEDGAFRDAFHHVEFPAEYERMAAWVVANRKQLEKPGVFAYRWLSRIPVPIAEPEGMAIPAAEGIGG